VFSALADADKLILFVIPIRPFHSVKFLADNCLHDSHPASDQRDSAEHYMVMIFTCTFTYFTRPCFCNQDVISVSLSEP
jgi:hypothetical protein